MYVAVLFCPHCFRKRWSVCLIFERLSCSLVQDKACYYYFFIVSVFFRKLIKQFFKKHIINGGCLTCYWDQSMLIKMRFWRTCGLLTGACKHTKSAIISIFSDTFHFFFLSCFAGKTFFHKAPKDCQNLPPCQQYLHIHYYIIPTVSYRAHTYPPQMSCE